MWRELVQIYALQARELSDEIARLGKHAALGPEALRLMEQVKSHQVLCRAAADELDRYIEQASLALAHHA